MDVAKSSSHCKKYLKYNTNTAADRQGKEAFLFNYQIYIIYGTGFDVALNYANKVLVHAIVLSSKTIK